MKSLNESGAPLLLTRHESSSSSADEEKNDRGQSLLDRLAAAFVAARPKQPGANYHRNMSAVLELPTSKACVNMSNGKRELEKEKSLTDSSTSSSAGSAGMGGGEGSRASAAAPASNGGGSKLSKVRIQKNTVLLPLRQLSDMIPNSPSTLRIVATSL